MQEEETFPGNGFQVTPISMNFQFDHNENTFPPIH